MATGAAQVTALLERWDVEDRDNAVVALSDEAGHAFEALADIYGALDERPALDIIADEIDSFVDGVFAVTGHEDAEGLAEFNEHIERLRELERRLEGVERVLRDTEFSDNAAVSRARDLLGI